MKQKICYVLQHACSLENSAALEHQLNRLRGVHARVNGINGLVHVQYSSKKVSEDRILDVIHQHDVTVCTDPSSNLMLPQNHPCQLVDVATKPTADLGQFLGVTYGLVHGLHLPAESSLKQLVRQNKVRKQKPKNIAYFPGKFITGQWHDSTVSLGTEQYITGRPTGKNEAMRVYVAKDREPLGYFEYRNLS